MSRIKAVIVLPMLTSSGIMISHMQPFAAVSGAPGSTSSSTLAHDQKYDQRDGKQGGRLDGKQDGLRDDREKAQAEVMEQPQGKPGVQEQAEVQEKAGASEKNYQRDQVKDQASLKKVKSVVLREEVMLRQLRIERILAALDRVAEAAAKMQPDRAEVLEPVVLDLASKALDLTSERAVLSSSTDEELEKLETTVQKLMTVLSKHVESEMSL